MDWLKNIFKNTTDESDPPDLEELYEVLPVLPLKDAILLPGAILPLVVTNPASAALIREFNSTNSPIVAVGMKGPTNQSPRSGRTSTASAALPGSPRYPRASRESSPS